MVSFYKVMNLEAAARAAMDEGLAPRDVVFDVLSALLNNLEDEGYTADNDFGVACVSEYYMEILSLPPEGLTAKYRCVSCKQLMDEPCRRERCSPANLVVLNTE